MARIIVHLGEQEREALRTLAKREMRDPRAQAALIIHQELERQGALPARAALSQTKGSVFEIQGGQS